jgi:oxygen-independent coproporphyrinogen-3 oxidase
MGYTPNRGKELLGLGCSSISEFNDLFAQNMFPPEPYQEILSTGKLPIIKGYQLDQDDITRKHLINNLMCNLEINIPPQDKMNDQKTIDEIAGAIGEIKHYEDKGLIVSVGSGYKVTPLGQLFLRNLAMPFDRYLSRETMTTFSQTI